MLGALRETTPEEEHKILRQIRDTVKVRNVETAVLLILRGTQPISRVGGMVSRFMLGPLMPFMGHTPEAWIWTLEKEENIQWLIEQLETEQDKKSL